MKILIAIPSLLTGGTEIQTLSLTEALTEGCHEVCVVCYFEYSVDMRSRFERAGATVVCLSEDGVRRRGIRAIWLLFRGLRSVVKRLRPDVVHVQYMTPGATPILILKALGVRRIIATAHTNADIYKSLRLVHFIQRHCVRAFTCITERAERSFFGSSQLYTTKTRLTTRNHFTIHNALPSYIDQRAHPREFGKLFTIGVVSRLEAIKGMDLILPAFGRILHLYPSVRLLVVGDGSQRKLMERQAQKMGLSDRVEWAGRQSGETLNDYYDRIDILLMPSRSEGFGLTAIEGMARGCVVVAADVGGLPEVIEDGVTGLLHTSESVESICERVNMLLMDRKMLSRISNNGVKYAMSFSRKHYSKLFNNLYAKLKCRY